MHYTTKYYLKIHFQAEYICDPNYLFGTSEQNWLLTCNGTHWTPAVVMSDFICRKGLESLLV